MPRKPKPTTTATAWLQKPESGAAYVTNWKDGAPVFLRPAPWGWEDVDRLYRVARGEEMEGDAEAIAALADRLKARLPKLPPTLGHLRAIRLGLGRLLGLVKRDGKTARPLPTRDFAALLGVSSRQAANYLKSVDPVPIRDPAMLAQLRAARRAMDRGEARDAKWLQSLLQRAVPLRSRQERAKHQTTHIRPLHPPGSVKRKEREA